jgi:hypothetical protein
MLGDWQTHLAHDEDPEMPSARAKEVASRVVEIFPIDTYISPEKRVFEDGQEHHGEFPREDLH